jgi:hypothetical protein
MLRNSLSLSLSLSLSIAEDPMASQTCDFVNKQQQQQQQQSFFFTRKRFGADLVSGCVFQFQFLKVYSVIIL